VQVDMKRLDGPCFLTASRSKKARGIWLIVFYLYPSTCVFSEVVVRLNEADYRAIVFCERLMILTGKKIAWFRGTDSIFQSNDTRRFAEKHGIQL
jgi:hypothetical protein